MSHPASDLLQYNNYITTKTRFFVLAVLCVPTDAFYHIMRVIVFLKTGNENTSLTFLVCSNGNNLLARPQPVNFRNFRLYVGT